MRNWPMSKNPMRKNGEVADLLDVIIRNAPSLPLHVQSGSMGGFPVSNILPAGVADAEGNDENGLIQKRDWGETVGVEFSWANYIMLSSNMLPLLLEVANVALESRDESVRAKAEEAARELVKVVQAIDRESVVKDE